MDADELLSHMVVADLVEATSEDEGEQLGCEGPQNDERTILDCVDEGEIDDLVEDLEPRRQRRATTGGTSTAATTTRRASATPGRLRSPLGPLRAWPRLRHRDRLVGGARPHGCGCGDATEA